MKKIYILSSLLIASLLMFCNIYVNGQTSRDCAIFQDIEHSAWAGTGYGGYANREVTDVFGKWSVSAVTQPDAKDHYFGVRGARFRGNTTSTDTTNINRIEMKFDKPNGLGTVSFYYSSFGDNTGTVHSGGVIYLDYSTNGGTTWTNVGSVTAPKWVDGGSAMLEATFNVNVSGNVRIKIYKLSQTGNTTVNIDNICITDYTPSNMVATPTFSPAGGNYLTTQNVTINCTTPGATIHYTLDGAIPTSSSSAYSTPIPVSTTTTIKAIGIKAGMDDSSIASATYTFPTPVANIAAFKATPTGATYKITGDVTFVYKTGRYIFIKDDSGGLVIYDNATPVITTAYNNGDIVSGGIIGTHNVFHGLHQLFPSLNTASGTPGATVLPKVVTMAELLANFATYEAQLLLLESVTFDAGTFGTSTTGGNINIHQGSDEMICRNHFNNITGYVTDPSKPYHVAGFAIPFDADKEICPRNLEDIFLPTSIVAPPVFSPEGGTFSEPVTVSIACATENAKIFYTTDGTEPTEDALLFTTPFTISETTTVKARAFALGLTPSVIVSATYVIVSAPEQVATPTLTPGGEYYVPIIVVIQCATPGASIYYTINGDDPTEDDTLFEDSIEISNEGTTVLKAKAFKTGMKPSEVATATYTFIEGIDEILGSSLHIYPNPTTGQLTIDNEQLTTAAPVGASSAKLINNLEIYDIMGKKQLSILNCQLSIVKIDISHLSNGIYFIKIETENGTVNKKIIKN